MKAPNKTVFTFFIFTILFGIKVQACDSTAVVLDSNRAWTVNPDTGYVIGFPCLDSNVIIRFKTPIKCSSISADGSNFKLINNDGWVVPAYKIEPICNGGSTTMIRVKFAEPMFYNTYAKVAILKGSNGNYIETTCGVEWKNDSIDIKVEGCFYAQLNINSLNRISFDTVQINWTSDTSSFPNPLFTAYNIYRKTTLDTGFVFIGSSTKLLAQSFTDGNLPKNYFGNISYYVGLSLNQKELSQTDTLSLWVSHKTAPMVFPNPAKDVINIALTGDGLNRLEIFNLNGSLVYSSETEENLVSIPVSSWSAGMYLINISGNNTYFQKVILY